MTITTNGLAWRWLDLRFFLALSFPIVGIYGVLQQPELMGLWVAAFFVVTAALDTWGPRMQRSPQPLARSSAYFSTILRLYVLLHLALQCCALWMLWHGDWAWVLSLSFGVGVITGALGITVAHELGHSARRADRVAAWVLMTSVGYAHFMVEHYRGHHPRAATWDDPATARQGESLWQFLPRVLAGSLLHALVLEQLRQTQFNQRWFQSPLVWAYLVKATFILTLMTLMALPMLAFWLLQSMVAIGLLESVNYIEHYGLRRMRQIPPMEPFNHFHAWTANHFLSNALLLNLQRHTDHHMNPWKPYASLVWSANEPQLPTGYAGCILLALVPRWWFAVMGPRLARVKQAQAKAALPPGADIQR